MIDGLAKCLQPEIWVFKSRAGEYFTACHIEYLHMPELGIESEKGQNLTTYKDYEQLFKEYDQNHNIKRTGKTRRIAKIIEDKHRVAITCFEADPYHCHRSRKRWH
ncbi:MAG: DUF488 domain-containing protein [Rickettsiales bacterium]